MTSKCNEHECITMLSMYNDALACKNPADYDEDLVRNYKEVLVIINAISSLSNIYDDSDQSIVKKLGGSLAVWSISKDLEESYLKHISTINCALNNTFKYPSTIVQIEGIMSKWCGKDVFIDFVKSRMMLDFYSIDYKKYCLSMLEIQLLQIGSNNTYSQIYSVARSKDIKDLNILSGLCRYFGVREYVDKSY